ncbi:MAG: hypothetical protein FWG20_05490, partial [Candidatus Cloacimonetes bacterium]|nr:hypothetical protein [Candidatus Cloacimonadota bacterium]
AHKVSVQLFDNVYYIGPSSLEDRADLSSFGMEVFALQEVINSPEGNLLLLDEFARGTNPSEGSKLYNAVIEFFTSVQNTTVLTATHFDTVWGENNISYFQITGIAESLFKSLLVNKEITLQEKLVYIHDNMNYQPVKVENRADIPKTALIIAELIGLEPDIINLAKNKD